MICVNMTASKAVAASGIIPFDNVICSTNDGISMSDSVLEIRTPGWYTASIYAVLSTTSATTAGVYMCQQDEPAEGTEVDFNIAANSSVVISHEFPIHVIPADDGVASISYKCTDAVTVDSATLIVKRVV